MSFDDLVSLLIAIVAILFMLVNTVKAEKKTKREEEYGYEDEEDEEEFEEVKEIQLPPPPKPKPVAKPVAVQRKPLSQSYEFEPTMDHFSQKTAIEDRHLPIHLRPADELVSDAFRDAEGLSYVPKRKVKNIRQLIKSLPEEQLLFLSYEVFHVPVSKRKSPFPWNG